jgi:hypothetical protein
VAADYPALHPAGHCGIRLDGCEVPAEALLGVEGEAYEGMALPFRDMEDAVGISGAAGNIAQMVGALVAALPRDAAVEVAAPVGRLVGLSAVLDLAAARVAAGLDEGRIEQGVMIGARALVGVLAGEIRAIGVLPGLAALEVGLSVARGPRAVRAARLARGG